PVVSHQDGGGVGAHPEEGAVPDRDLPRIAREQVEPEGGDGEGDGVAVLVDLEGLEALRDESEHHDDHRGEPPTDAEGPPVGTARVDSAWPHTRTTCLEPNSPWGRTRRMMRISTKAEPRARS